jgi:hypothetical protein
VVWDDHNLLDTGGSDLLGVLIAPARGATRRRRRGDPERPETVDVLFALDPDDAALFGELHQAVNDAPHALEVRDPATGAVGATRPEVLRLVADDLVEQDASLVLVVVRRKDLPSRAVILGWRLPVTLEQVARLASCRAGCHGIRYFLRGSDARYV